MKNKILDKMESRNLQTVKNINQNINFIKKEVDQNREEIIKINDRIDRIEQEGRRT